MPFASEDRLRREIYLAPAGATISVEPGEHNGPFLFSRPITLVGKTSGKTLPTLIALRGPVAIVESPNVQLQNLEFVVGDGDYRQVDPVLVHAPYCAPIVKDVLFGKGRLEDMTNANQTSGWDLPTMIAFGDLREKAWVALPLDIKVPGPTAIRSLLSGMRVDPEHLSEAGVHQLMVYFGEGLLLKDTMLAGQLIFDYAGESKTVWIIGNVLAEKDFKAKGYPELVLGGPGGRIITGKETFTLGRAQFLGERGADRWPETLAFIIRETGQVWSLVQTRPQPVPLRLNRQLVLVGHRQVLKEGDELEVGDMKFQVLPRGKKSALDVTGVLDFGKLSKQGSPEAAPPRLMVTNKSKTSLWEGKLRSSVPWIKIPGEKFVCPPDKQVSVQLALDAARLGKLPRGPQGFYGALVLENDKEAWVIKALLDVDIDPSIVTLEITPRHLDLHKVTRPEDFPGGKVVVRNTGSVAWSGTLRCARWLAAMPTNLTVPPGKTAEVALSLNANINDLLEGPNSESEALVFEGQQVREFVTARIDIEHPRPSLQVTPLVLDFGTIKDLPSAEVRLAVQNSGTADWQGELQTRPDWLEVVDSRGKLVQGLLRLPAQGKADLIARLKLLPPAGTYTEAAAVQWVRDNKSELSQPLNMVVEEIKIDPDPGMIEFKITADPASREKTLKVWNRSAQVWAGDVVSTLSWLVVSPKQVSIAPGKMAAVTVSVVMSQVRSTERLRTNRVKPVADAILLQAGPVVVAQVGAAIQVIDIGDGGNIPDGGIITEGSTTVIQGHATLETLQVDFGRLPPPGDALPAGDIVLKNPGERPVECSARALVDWLTVEPLRIKIMPKEQFRLKAALNEAARKLPPNRYLRDDGIQVDWNNQAHNVRVILTVEEPPAPPPPPPADKIDFGRVSIPLAQPVSKEISFFNSRFYPVEVVAKASAAAPWLTITPERIQCPSKQTCTVSVSLNPAVNKLSSGLLTLADAILVEIEQKVLRYSVVLDPVKTEPVDSPPPPPLPQQPVIDFGEVMDLTAGFPSRTFQLTNTSNQPKEGRVLDTAFVWLTVTPTEFRIEPGGKVDLKVQLNRKARARSYDEESAIIIELSGKQIPIRVKANVRKALVLTSASVPLPVPPPQETAPVKPPEPAYPELDLAKGVEQLTRLENLLDFGTYISSPAPLPSRTLALVNSSDQPISGTVKFDVFWLNVNPLQFDVAPGAKLLIQIGLSEEARITKPRGKPYKAPDAVCIQTTTAQIFCLRASVQFQAPPAP